ncbi:MAG: cupredoxin domain-containing protein, partial [Pseudonocardiales bacterium]|nr:cupredoxin domain-containing protein [Pseudonocardiales bacterium]
MRHVTTSLALPAVAAAIAILAGTAIAVGIMSSPSTATPPAPAAPAPMGAEQTMPGMAMPRAGTPMAVPGQDAPVATDSVAIQNFAFSPTTVTVKAGSTVTWTNRDQDAHTVTAMSGPFHSPTLTTGQSFRYTFTTPGRYDYLC